MSDRSNAMWKRVFTVAAVVAALAVSVLSTLSLPEDWRLLTDSETTVGVVVSDPTSHPCSSGDDRYWTADVTYTDGDGRPYTGHFGVKGCGQTHRVEQGTEFEVRYMASDPTEATTFAASSIRRDVILEFLFGPVLFLGVLLLGGREALRWQRQRREGPPPPI